MSIKIVKRLIYSFLLIIIFFPILLLSGDAAYFNFEESDNFKKYYFYSPSNQKSFRDSLETYLLNEDCEGALNFIKNSNIKDKTKAFKILEFGSCCHVAAYFNYDKVLEKLYKKNKYYQGHRDSAYGSTPLHVASIQKHLRSATLLLKIDPESVRIKNNFGVTPLHMASWVGDVGIIKILLKANADINAQDELHNTALHLCVENGYFKSTQLLLSNGADTSIVNNFGCCAFDLASRNGSINIARLLLKHNAYINNWWGINSTGIINARNHQARIIKPLMFNNKTKAFYTISRALRKKRVRQSLLKSDRSGISPLYWSVYRNNPRVLRKFLDIISDMQTKHDNQLASEQESQNNFKVTNLVRKDENWILNSENQAESLLAVAYNRNYMDIHQMLYSFLRPDRAVIIAMLSLYLKKLNKSEIDSLPQDIYEYIMEFVHGPRPVFS